MSKREFYQFRPPLALASNELVAAQTLFTIAEAICNTFYGCKYMRTQEKTIDDVEAPGASELDLPVWSVVSFDKREAVGVTYDAAVELCARLDAEGVAGLCIVTDAASARLT